MDTDRFEKLCPHGCGRKVGEHMARGESLDDCTWLNVALQVDYDTAAYFVRQGRWSQDQFDAFCAHHPYSAWSGRQIDARSEVGRLAMLLAGAIVNKKHGVPHSTGLPIQARNRRGEVVYRAAVDLEQAS